jgi:hypothetical protein
MFKSCGFIKNSCFLNEAVTSNREVLINKTEGANLNLKVKTNKWNFEAAHENVKDTDNFCHGRRIG